MTPHIGDPGLSMRAQAHASVERTEAFRRSLDRVFAWDFERIVMGHGDVADRDARSVALRP